MEPRGEAEIELVGERRDAGTLAELIHGRRNVLETNKSVAVSRAQKCYLTPPEVGPLNIQLGPAERERERKRRMEKREKREDFCIPFNLLLSSLGSEVSFLLLLR